MPFLQSQKYGVQIFKAPKETNTKKRKYLKQQEQNNCNSYKKETPESKIAVAQSVERATPGEEVPVSIPAVAARSLLVGSVSV